MGRSKIVANCPVSLTMQTVGGKWKLIILWHLRKKKLRFSQLEKQVEGISQKMLTQQLRELEADGLVKRTVYPVVPPKVEYELTDKGRSLDKVLKEMNAWGKNHMEQNTY